MALKDGDRRSHALTFLMSPESISSTLVFTTLCDSDSSWQGGKSMWLPSLTMRHCDGGFGGV